jgi:DNA primase
MEALVYLRGRGIGRKSAEALGMRLLPPGRIYIPYFNNMGDPIYWTARSFDGREPKYLNKSGVPAPPWHMGADDFSPVLVEGVFDAIAATTVGFHGIALGGKKVSRPQWPVLERMLHKDLMVRVCLDGDAVPESLKLSEELSLRGYVAQPIFLDAGQDPGGMDPGKLLEVLF